MCLSNGDEVGTVTLSDTSFPQDCWSRMTVRYRKRIQKLRRYIRAGQTVIGRGIDLGLPAQQLVRFRG
jgi:hypothetical protein